MTELSPAAQAVLDAVVDGAFPPFHVIARPMAAAALEAVADQLLPEPNSWDEDSMSRQGLLLLRLKRAQLLTIAAELRGGTATNQEGYSSHA